MILRAAGESASYLVISLFFQNDPEGCSPVNFGIPDKNLAVVVILNDPFNQRQAEAPASGFGGISRLEDYLVI